MNQLKQRDAVLTSAKETNVQNENCLFIINLIILLKNALIKLQELML